MRSIIKQVLKEEIDFKSDRVKSIVNKYGFERAIEMVAGGMGTIKQAYQSDPLSYLDQFNNLIPVEKDDKIFYVDKDGFPLFYYNPDEKNGYVYINYHRIWMFFKEVINIEYSEIQDIINKWLDETYNLTGLTPPFIMNIYII